MNEIAIDGRWLPVLEHSVALARYRRNEVSIWYKLQELGPEVADVGPDEASGRPVEFQLPDVPEDLSVRNLWTVGGVAARVVCTHCKHESSVGWARRTQTARFRLGCGLSLVEVHHYVDLRRDRTTD